MILELGKIGRIHLESLVCYILVDWQFKGFRNKFYSISFTSLICILYVLFGETGCGDMVNPFGFTSLIVYIGTLALIFYYRGNLIFDGTYNMQRINGLVESR